jgi:hypothetical protein
MSILTLKIATLYAACSPELGVVSYGRCQDEALNNLTDEIRLRPPLADYGRHVADRQGTEGRHNAELAREKGNSHV